MQHVAAYERLAARAAVTGDRALVHKALLTHPLVAQDAVSVDLVDRLLEAGAQHLPQFETGTPV
jgi:6-phospho-beta-glucosidase